MSDIQVSAKIMNKGTQREFVRVFFACECGADLGSAPLDTLTKVRTSAWSIEALCFTCRVAEERQAREAAMVEV